MCVVREQNYKPSTVSMLTVDVSKTLIVFEMYCLLLWTRQCVKCFMYAALFNLHNSPVRKILL